MIFGRQPVYILAAINAILALGIGFGLNLTGEQVGLIMAASTAIIALITNSVVTPVAAPQLPAGTEVKVQGTDTTSTVG